MVLQISGVVRLCKDWWEMSVLNAFVFSVILCFSLSIGGNETEIKQAPVNELEFVIAVLKAVNLVSCKMLCYSCTKKCYTSLHLYTNLTILHKTLPWDTGWVIPWPSGFVALKTKIKYYMINTLQITWLCSTKVNRVLRENDLARIFKLKNSSKTWC